MSLDQNCRTVTTKCWLFLPSKLCIVKFSDCAGTLSPIFSATRSTWSMWSSTSTFWTPSSTGGSQSLGQGWPGSKYVHKCIHIFIFCRWLASSETHSVLPDVFPMVSNHFKSENIAFFPDDRMYLATVWFWRTPRGLGLSLFAPVYDNFSYETESKIFRCYAVILISQD